VRSPPSSASQASSAASSASTSPRRLSDGICAPARAGRMGANHMLR
jgi:hypothetical protein